jgi:hypothetical protein
MSAACEEIRELLPELALGILGGEERARVLEHLTGCGDCTAELAVLSRAADGLLTLAPQEEPPVGFEERVVSHLRRERPRRRAPRIVAMLAAAAAIAAIAAGSVYALTGNDRHLASYYRGVLGVAHGHEFAAARLDTQEGIEGGQVFTYEGKPSWVFVVVRGAVRDGMYTIVGELNGSDVMLGRIKVDGGDGDWGGTTRIKTTDLTGIRLLAADGTAALAGHFPKH